MSDTHQMTNEIQDRIKAFHESLAQEFGLKSLRFRYGYGGIMGEEKSRRVRDGITQVKIKTRNLDLEFEVEE